MRLFIKTVGYLSFGRSSNSKRSAPPMDTRNTRGVTGTQAWPLAEASIFYTSVAGIGLATHCAVIADTNQSIVVIKKFRNEQKITDAQLYFSQTTERGKAT
uniref:SFRICE_026538 n=1 Tax=Spodoptera frugiperda TaxID=7108 RepID=A0A2H1W0F3_SPOFR